MKPIRIKSITEGHRLSGFSKPYHPLISIIDIDDFVKRDSEVTAAILDFYMITLKRNCEGLHYGQQKYDFDEGVMAFIGPNQVLRGEENARQSNRDGWILFIHPDFLWHTTLAKKIKRYDYFSYATNEALFLSPKEESIIDEIINNIKGEYKSNIDRFSQEVIIAQLELLFTYAERFYERQFITRKITNYGILDRVETVITEYFNNEELLASGLPTVQHVADNLNISVKYLSSLLKQLTGLTTQQHIHEKLLEKAKEKLSTTDLSISEIAYKLGFEHSQSFSKFFKKKTKQSPIDFRRSFN